MSEFNDRVAAQRAVLRVVNRIQWKEPLFSLSSRAITRWVMENRLDPNLSMIQLITKVSSALFFLANRSQEQVTDEYRAKSAEVRRLTAMLEGELLEVRVA
jgi:hypothetical protein